MKAFPLILAAVMMLMHTAAFACSPPAPGMPVPSAEDAAKEMVISSGDNFLGKVEVVEFEKISQQSYKVKFKVLKQYAGAPVNEIDVLTSGNTCGVYVPKTGMVDIIAPSESMAGSLPILTTEFPRSVSNEALEKALDDYTAQKGAQ